MSMTLYKATWAFLQMTQNCIAQSVYQRTPQFYRMTSTQFYPFLTFLNIIIAPSVLFLLWKWWDVNYCRISTVTEERDLGIVFDGDLKFTLHVNQIVMKANRVLGIVKHTFASRDTQTVRLLYATLVRPILDYSSTVWNPYLMKNIRKLEAIQRKATKLIPSFYNMSYSERLQKLNLPSLLYCRTRMDL